MKKRTLWARLICMVLLLTLLTGCSGLASRPTAEEYIVGKWVFIGSYRVYDDIQDLKLTHNRTNEDFLHYIRTKDGVVTVTDMKKYYIFSADNTVEYSDFGKLSEGTWTVGHPESGASYWGENKNYVYGLAGSDELSGGVLEGLFGLPDGVEYFLLNEPDVDYELIKNNSFITTMVGVNGGLFHDNFTICYYFMKVVDTP